MVGGHLDSWDVGAGATDDGGGCVVTWEALRIMKKLNLRPRRTVRVVLWTNEENGTRGGLAYRDQHRAELANHVMMLESDNGVFRPLGFGFSGSDTVRQKLRAIATLLRGIAADAIVPGGGGADINPSTREARIPALALAVDESKYFLIHHTPADTVDKIDPVEMAKSAAAVAVMTYVVADLPDDSARGPDAIPQMKGYRTQMNTHKFARSLGIGAFVVLVGACSSSAQQARTLAPGDVAATVGSASITLEQLDEKALEQPAGSFGSLKLSQALYERPPRRRRRDHRQPAARSGSQAPGHRPREADPAADRRSRSRR